MKNPKKMFEHTCRGSCGCEGRGEDPHHTQSMKEDGGHPQTLTATRAIMENSAENLMAKMKQMSQLMVKFKSKIVDNKLEPA